MGTGQLRWFNWRKADCQKSPLAALAPNGSRQSTVAMDGAHRCKASQSLKMRMRTVVRPVRWASMRA